MKTISGTSKRMTLLSFALLIFVLSGCSSFRRDWNKTAGRADPTNNITGRWIGTWQNTNNTHQDRMRAVITSVNDHQYQAHFHAFYKKVLTFSYTIVLDAVGPAEDVQLTGEADLGKLAGGVYRYEGRATPVDFTCKYSSKYDIGTFTLHRVPLAK